MPLTVRHFEKLPEIERKNKNFEREEWGASKFLLNFTYYILQPNMFNTNWQLKPLRKTFPYLELFWSAFFPYFPAFWLHTPYLSVFSPNAGKCGENAVSLRIQSECGKMREKCNISPHSVRMRENEGKMPTRITPNTDSF